MNCFICLSSHKISFFTHQLYFHLFFFCINNKNWCEKVIETTTGKMVEVGEKAHWRVHWGISRKIRIFYTIPWNERDKNTQAIWNFHFSIKMRDTHSGTMQTTTFFYLSHINLLACWYCQRQTLFFCSDIVTVICIHKINSHIFCFFLFMSSGC